MATQPKPRSTDWPRLTFRSTGRTFSARSRQVLDGKTVTITWETETAAREEPSQTADHYEYVGNASSKVAHLATCGKLPGEANRVYFETLEEAVAAGYRKHAGCLGN